MNVTPVSPWIMYNLGPLLTDAAAVVSELLLQQFEYPSPCSLIPVVTVGTWCPDRRRGRGCAWRKRYLGVSGTCWDLLQPRQKSPTLSSCPALPLPMTQSYLCVCPILDSCTLFFFFQLKRIWLRFYYCKAMHYYYQDNIRNIDK